MEKKPSNQLLLQVLALGFFLKSGWADLRDESTEIFLPFGPEMGDENLNIRDDGFVSKQGQFLYFDNMYDTVYVSLIGFLTKVDVQIKFINKPQ